MLQGLNTTNIVMSLANVAADPTPPPVPARSGFSPIFQPNISSAVFEPLTALWGFVTSWITSLWQTLVAFGGGMIANALSPRDAVFSPYNSWNTLVGKGDSSILQQVLSLAAPIIVIAAVLQFVVAAWTRDKSKLWRGWVGIIAAAPLSIISVWFILTIKSAVDAASFYLGQSTLGGHGERLLEVFCVKPQVPTGPHDPNSGIMGSWGQLVAQKKDASCYFNHDFWGGTGDMFNTQAFDKIKDMTGMANLFSPQIFLAIFGVMFFMAACSYWITMTGTDAAVIMIAAVAPIAFMILPLETGKTWITNWFKIGIALIMAKPLSVIILATFTGIINPGGGDQLDTIPKLLAAIIALLTAVGSPAMCLKLVDFTDGRTMQTTQDNNAVAKGMNTAAGKASKLGSSAAGSAMGTLGSIGKGILEAGAGRAAAKGAAKGGSKLMQAAKNTLGKGEGPDVTGASRDVPKPSGGPGGAGKGIEEGVKDVAKSAENLGSKAVSGAEGAAEGATGAVESAAGLSAGAGAAVASGVAAGAYEGGKMQSDANLQAADAMGMGDMINGKSSGAAKGNTDAKGAASQAIPGDHKVESGASDAAKEAATSGKDQIPGDHKSEQGASGGKSSMSADSGNKTIAGDHKSEGTTGAESVSKSGSTEKSGASDAAKDAVPSGKDQIPGDHKNEQGASGGKGDDFHPGEEFQKLVDDAFGDAKPAEGKGADTKAPNAEAGKADAISGDHTKDSDRPVSNIPGVESKTADKSLAGSSTGSSSNPVKDAVEKSDAPAALPAAPTGVTAAESLQSLGVQEKGSPQAEALPATGSSKGQAAPATLSASSNSSPAALQDSSAKKVQAPQGPSRK